ncbi:MAG: barstar family protein [Planctomycetota bacterium]
MADVDPTFVYGDAAALTAGHGPSDHVARLPRGLRGKTELLAALAGALSFPEYFGDNWDALSDCMTDLSWLPAKRVLLVHADLPLWRNDDQRTYLELLRDALQSWADDAERDVVIGFAEADRAEIERLLGDAS